LAFPNSFSPETQDPDLLRMGGRSLLL